MGLENGDLRLKDFVALFNAERFFEAHEILEASWRRAEGERRHFYHGLIQMAAAFVHFERKNPAGYKTLFSSACAYFEKCPSFFERFPLQKLIDDTKKCLEENASCPRIELW